MITPATGRWQTNMIGGESYMDQFLKYRKGHRGRLNEIGAEVIEGGREHKEQIQKHQVLSIETWIEIARQRDWTPRCG